MNSVQAQYERAPYPPVNPFALPKKDEGQGLSYELGSQVVFGKKIDHANRTILIAGCGTFETLVVAQTHPKAKLITAVDFSQRSLKILRRRLMLMRLARRRLPPIQLICADLTTWAPPLQVGPFDYILCSNMIHHVADPAFLLKRLSAWLKPDGILRVVTYPKSSRIFMRETSNYLHRQGLTPESKDLVQQARPAIDKLPLESPVRSCFESQPETKTRAGLIDAFFNACENPLSPLEWAQASREARLELMAETQTETSRAEFLTEILPQTSTLSRWTKLQILDDLLELCANPILWFKKSENIATEGQTPTFRSSTESKDLYAVLASYLRRAETLLAPAGVSLSDAIETLRREVGPRVSVPPHERILPGLSIIDYDYRELLKRS